MRAPDTFDTADLLKWLAWVQTDRPVIPAAPLCEPGLGRYLRLQHDVDLSPAAALRLAEHEHAIGVRATYTFMVGAAFYDVTSPPVTRLIDRIVQRGHNVGLHVDPRGYHQAGLTIAAGIERDVKVMRAVGHEPLGVCFHKPRRQGLDDRDLEPAGLPVLARPGETYISDSAGGFSDEAVDLLSSLARDQVRLNLHPEWWIGSPRRATLAGVFNSRLEQIVDAADDYADIDQHPHAQAQDARDRHSGNPARRARVAA